MLRRLCWAVFLIGLVGAGGALSAQAPAGVISTYAGGGKSNQDGALATNYKLDRPSDVAVDNLGNIYIADRDHHKVLKVDHATQFVTTVAGTGTQGYNGDNRTATSARLDKPVGLAFDAAGNLYISESGNERVRRVDKDTGNITTYAGTGSSGYNGDGIQATQAHLNDPYHISFDQSGNLYIADSSNNRVRRVGTGGIILTVAGTGHAGYNGDNRLAIFAELNKPLAAVTDGSGNLYIADNENQRVRLVRAGTITTYAGTGDYGSSGDGRPATSAQLKGPNNIGLDAAGNVYIVDGDANKIRQVNKTSLIINTVAGDGQSGYNGDGGLAVDASLAAPYSATFDAQGRMYIAGSGSDVVRLVTFIGSPATIAATHGSPQTTRVNTSFPERLTATVRDSNGLGVPGATVTFTAPAAGASATLTSSTAVTGTQGEAYVFATANSTAGSYSVTATTAGVAAPATFSLTNTVSAFVDIAFVRQPSNTKAGAPISPPVTVRVRDLNGNPVGGAPVTVGIFASSRSIQGTIVQTTDANGIATFADLKVDTVGTYTLQASTGAAPPVGSIPFTVTPGAPSSVLVLSGSGQSTTALTSFADALKAKVVDAFGNVVPLVAVTFAAPASGPSATFGGPATVITGSDGIATSPILTANSTAGTFNVTATAAGASSAAFNLTNLASVPKSVTFVQQPPSSTAAGSAMTPPIIVQVQDEFQNPLPGVQVAMLLEGPSQDLTGTTTRLTGANGRATFNDLSIKQAGANYRLHAVALSSNAEALSNSFTITGAAPAAISVLSGGTQSATILTPYAIPLTVIVEDQYLNPVSGATVVFTAPPSGASGLFSGSTTANVVTNAEGQAAATITANGTAGAFTATAGVGAFSAPFHLTNTPGTPGRIVFSQQPPATVTAGAAITPPVQVKLEDGSGNGVPGVAVTLTPSSRKRSAPVTADTDSGGFATFGTLTINTAGEYVLEAVAGAVSSQSNTFTVTAGSAALMTAYDGSGQTSTVATLFHPLQARVTDSFGNPVSGVSVTFTPPSSGPSVTGIPATVTTGSDGIATSPTITANTVAGTFQVTATGAGSATFNLTNAPGAGILKFIQQPSNATAGVPMPAIKVQIQDTFNNPVNTPNVPVTLQLSPAPPATTSPTANTDATGTATFNAFSVSVAGSYELLALAAGLQSGGSASFNITAGPAANILAVGGTPESTVVATPFPLPLVALVTDSFANPAPNATIVFTVVPSGGAGGTFGGSSTASVTTDQEGLAIAPTLTANTTAGTFTVTATVGGNTATWTLTNIAGAVDQITFETQPSTTTAGAPISPPVVVKLADSHGNPVGGATIVLTPKEGPGSLEGTQTAVTAGTGEATFADLTLTASGSYQLEASAVGVLQRSVTFQITAKTTNLGMHVIDGTGQNASIGTAYALPLQVLVSDEFANPVTGASVLFSVPSVTGASVTFNGLPAVTTGADGIATSPTMTANAVVGLVIPVATSPGAAVPAVFALANVSGPATRLVFVQQPGDSAAGAAIAPPVTVQLLDAVGNPVRQGGVTVTLQLSPPGGGFSTGSAPATQNTAADGVATFAGLAVAQAGTYQLQAQSEGLEPATSTSFVISPAAPSSVTVVAGNNQSAAVTTNYVIPLKVSVQDSLANPVPGVVVTFTAPSSGPSVTFLGPVTVTTDGLGVAGIFVTANSQVGSFQVTATAPGTAAPAVFSLTNVSGSASHLSFVQQPSSAVSGAVITPPVTVQLTDSIGNNVAQAGVAVTLSLNPAAGRSAALTGTTTVATSASGLATFADLSIATAGSYQLTAVGTSLVSAQSSAFTITAGPAAGIQASGGTPQSTTVLAPFAVPLQVLVSDSAGNPLSGVAVTFAAPATGASATLSSATATTDAGGHASVSAVANATVGSYTVTASVAGVTPTASFALTNVGGTGVNLVFTGQPVDTPAGTVISPPVVVRVTDSGGNPVSGVTIALTAQGSPGVLSGAAPVVTDASGLATFSNLSIDKTGTYSLRATDGARATTSNTFVIGPGTASSITVVAGNGQSAAVTTNYASQLKASVQDALGNGVPGVAVTFTAPASGASVTFSGSATVTTDSSGVAAISVTANTQVGSFEVTATAPGTAAPAVFSLTNVAGSASHLAFVQQPSSAVAGAVITPPVTVQLTDSIGNSVAQAGVAVTLTLNPAAGRSAAISGASTVLSDAGGLATFADLSIATAGSYQLTALGTSLVSAQSSAFTISAGPAAAIQASGGTPQSTTVLAPFAVPLQVLVSDSAGNPLNGVAVSFTAPATGASATLSSATATTDASGHAGVSAVANAAVGSYTVTASVAGAGVTPTAGFALTNVGGTGVNLVFTQQPVNTPAGTVMAPVVVKVTDSGGNPVSAVTIALTAQGGPGILSGAAPVATDASGLATFSNLSIDKTGTYALRASDGTRFSTSNSFVIGPGTASSITVLAGNGQSAAVTTNYASQLKARVQDALGNGVPGVAVTFTAPASGASVTFSGPATVTTDSSGVAAISVTANTQVGSFQVTATAPGTAAPAVFSLTNVSGSASHLSFVQQPSSAVSGAVITPPVTVQLTDSIGNNVAQAGVAVTLSLNPAAGRSAALTGTTTVATSASGLATFADLSIATAGSYQLTAVGTSLVSAQSSAFTITAGPAAGIQASGGTPQSTTVLAPFAVPLQVLVSDSAGNPLSGVAVTFAAPATGASATLSSATATTDAGGHASVSAVANATVGSYTVTASVAGVTPTASFALTNVGGTGVNLVFTGQPVDTPAGTVIAPPVVVRVTDSGGNPVSGVTIALTAQGSPGVLSGAAPVVTDASGLATFSNLSIDKTGTYSLRATDGARATTSNTFVIGPGTASSITVVAGNGQSAAVTTNYASQLKASVQDALGNGVPGVAVTFTAPASGASVTFSGSATVTTDSSGVAAISVTANTQVGSFEVTATAPGTAAPAVFSLTNVAGSASHLAFVQQPSSAVAGAVITPPVTVQLTDSIGNSVAQAGVAVTLTLNPAAGRSAAITGASTVLSDAGGLATFADLSIATAGSYQLTALGTSLVSAQSSAFTISAGPAAAIQASGGTPQSTTVLAPFAVPLQVLVSDSAGNPLNGVAVSFTAPATGASATLSSATATTDASGHAGVSAVANAAVGSYTVTASVAGAGVTPTAGFALTNVGGTGVNLAFTQQPVNTPAGTVMAPVVVKVTDSGGNPVSAVTIALTAQGGPGILSGAAPVATDASGLATFSNLSIDKTGTYALRASDGTRFSTSNSFVIGPGTASSITVLAGNGQSAAVTTNYASQLKARVQDALGNGVPGVAVTFTAPASGASVTFSGPATVTTDSSGVAAISVTANTQVGSFQVTATAPGTAAPAVFSLTNVSGSASHLSFVQQPSSAVSGAVITPPVTVQLTDSIGNNVAQAGVAVTLSLNPAAGRSAALTGTTTVATSASGLATFADLSIATAGSYQLTAVGTSLVSAQSSAFTITAGPAAGIQASGGTPQSTTVLAPFAVPLQVLVSDSAGNPLSGVAVTFAAPATGASATLSSATATTDAGGHASVSAVANATVGSYTVTASVAGVTPTASFALTNVGGTGVNLVFTGQPVDTPAGTVISPPVEVRVTDSGGNPVSGVTIALTAQGSPGVLSGAAPVVTDASGLATFSNLSIDKTGTYSLRATDGARASTSNSFVIGPGTASSITVVAGNGQSAAVTTNYASQLKASVQDALGNGVPGVAVTFTAPASGASVTFSGSATVTTDSSGVAAISVTANTQVGSFEVTATAPGTAAPAVFSLTNVAGSASHLAFVQQPSSAVAGAVITPPVTVQLTDSIGNSVAQAGVAVTLTLNPAAGRSAAISGASTVLSDAGGLATFADLSIATAGSYQLTALGTSLVSAQSSAFTISAGPAAAIQASGGTPQSTTVLAPFAVPLQVLVSDSAGNPLNGVAVSFTAPATGASATLSSATATTDASGHAGVSAVANAAVGSYTVTASVAGAGVTPTAGFALTNVGGTGVNLAFTQQPVNTPAGTVMAPVVVKVTDSGGNPVSGVTIALTAQGGPGVLSGAAPVDTDASGLATFSTLSIDKTGTYALRASDGTRFSTSNTFVIGPGTASSITVTGGSPQSAVVLSAFAVPLQVTVQDTAGNPVSGLPVAFLAPKTGPSATLSPAQATTDSAGRASVNASANGLAGSYEVIAVASGVTTFAEFSLTNDERGGAGGQLVFTQQPSNTPAGNILTPVTVRLADSGGAPVAGAVITLSLDNSGVPLIGTLTRLTDATGQAVFADLSVKITGTYRLTANALTSLGKSNSFQITPAASVSITAISGTGQTTPVNTTYIFPLKADVRDTFGNAVPGASVIFTAPASGPGVVFEGSTSVIADNTGVATSPPMTANAQPGSFQVAAMTPGAVSQALFSLTNISGATGRLSFVQQPTDTRAGAVMIPPLSVQLLDNAGNPVRTAGVPVSLVPNSVAGPTSAFSGSLTGTTDASGLATFADLSGATAGTYQLTAQSGSLGSATSATFRITTGPPAAIRTTAGTPQSAAVFTAFATPLEVAVTDSSGNPISGVSVIFTAPGTGASGTFGGASTSSITTGERGTASVTLTANGTPGTYVVSAATAAVKGPVTFSLTNVAAPARVLAFVQQPGTVASGQAISPAVKVQVRENSGAPVNTAGIAISMILSSGTGELSGSSVSVTTADGIATFDNLRIDLAGTKRLRAAGIEFTAAESNSFVVTAGQASRIAAVGNTPQVTRPSQVFPAPLQAMVTDSAGNPVSGVPVTFTVPATGSSGSFSSAPTVTTGANGIATAPVLTANSTAGTFSATATTPNVAGVATFALVILPPASAELTLDEQVLTFVSEIEQSAPPPKTVTVSAVSGAAVAWTASRSASWLTVSPISGVTPGQASVSANPAGLTAGTYVDTVTFTPPAGEAVVLVVSYTITPRPALTVTPGSLIFQTLYQSDGTIPVPSAQTLSATSSSRPISYQISTTVTSPPGGSWLKLSTAQGQTPGAVQVSVTPEGLSEGIYRGSVQFQPTETGVSPVFVPVTLVVGCNRGACAAPPTESPAILGVVNSASFHISGAPGAAMTIFGRNLSTSTMQALAYPLPTTLGTTMVMVNGAPAPLYYVSPGQINFQMPSDAPLGNARVEVNVEGQHVSSFDAQPVMLTAVDPGLYMNGPRAAALNPDLTPHTAATPQAAGAILAFYLTGQGTVKPAIPDGSAAPAAPLSMVDGAAQATIGGQPAEVIFAGLAPGFAGLTQINVRIPEGLSPGDHPAFIVINGIPSNAGLISVR